MDTFIPQSYQLQESKKWIPRGTVVIDGEVNIVEMRDKEFDTQKEANKFFADYYTEKGFVENISN